ncbi:Protease Do-like 7 [Morella rubra]|uniref:Pro-apoptotic serine protease NMA111 n=1 Tax=Morella rubra TaxID=262757 RepID=A0A6A1VEW0_9ROSI|nr:Protease Do-like 7 [Morella rubra]
MEDTLERLGLESMGLLEGASAVKDELCMEIDPPFRENVATAEDWRRALDKVVPAVVVLHTTACRAFDTNSAGASYATGFVVDKRRGIILSNRHVVKTGPVVAEAMFVNREEISVHPVYRDPVHDFGFFRYDPGAIQFLNYDEIPLAPEAACVGLEIRVVGNDSGEKVSILAGTLARLDRDAPHYKKDGYNDFNTFYMQAASGTKGGSSGSPVIDILGRAVGLNAGSKSSSAPAFFLPLEQVVRALKFVQKGSDSYANKWEAVSIPRGTLQVTFLHKGFDETRRLSLRSETEQMVRHASPHGETGMLVVDSVVPGGPAHKRLEPGDVLVRANGEVITQFLKLETLLDDSVNHNIELLTERGGTLLTVNLVVCRYADSVDTANATYDMHIVAQVQDLHSITPYYFLEVSGAVIHPLSYQQARNFHFHCGLVYVTEPGYMFSRAGVPRHAIIKKFAGEEISCLEELISVLFKLSRGARVPLEYISYTDRHRRKSVLVTVDRHDWYAPPQIHTRDDTTGLWTAKPAFQPDYLLLPSDINDIGDLGVQTFSTSGEANCTGHLHQSNNQELTDSVASLEINCDDTSDEARPRDDSVGTKIRRVEEDLSADGSVVCDCSFNEAKEMKMEDPNTVQNTILHDFHGATATADNSPSAERVIEPTLVMVELKFGSNSSQDHQFVGGIPIYTISQVLDKIISGANGSPLLINGVRRPMPLVRILEVELYPTLLSKARNFGLGDNWVEALVKKDPIRRQVLRVKGCLAGSKAENLLEQGDMVLAINKEPVTCFHDIENACRALDKYDNNDGKLNLTIFRQGHEIEILVGTDVRDGNGTTRVINWCGCIVQDPHPAVRALGFLPEEGHGVYVVRWCHGSPVHRYGLHALQWIVEVNGKPTPDLDALVNVTKELEHGEFVRVRTVYLNGKPRVLTLKQDLHYWPTWELRFDPDTAMWHRKTIKALDCSNV